jgi:hypothetical protein
MLSHDQIADLRVFHFLDRITFRTTDFPVGRGGIRGDG